MRGAGGVGHAEARGTRKVDALPHRGVAITIGRGAGTELVPPVLLDIFGFVRAGDGHRCETTGFLNEAPAERAERFHVAAIAARSGRARAWRPSGTEAPCSLASRARSRAARRGNSARRHVAARRGISARAGDPAGARSSTRPGSAASRRRSAGRCIGSGIGPSVSTSGAAAASGFGGRGAAGERSPAGLGRAPRGGLPSSGRGAASGGGDASGRLRVEVVAVSSGLGARARNEKRNGSDRGSHDATRSRPCSIAAAT
jgi:hypothetical protein